MKRESPFDGVYAVLFVATAWQAAASIYWAQWVDLLFFAVPFTSWTLWRGGFRGP